MVRDCGELLRHLRERLPGAFEGSDVRAAYLFGSYARGAPTNHSDVDLAVYLGKSEVSLDELLDLARRVRGATGLEVDLSVLDNASLRFLHRVLLEGQLLYSADESARVSFEVRMRKLSGDFALHAERVDRALLAATASGRR